MMGDLAKLSSQKKPDAVLIQAGRIKYSSAIVEYHSYDGEDTKVKTHFDPFSLWVYIWSVKMAQFHSHYHDFRI